MTKRYLLPASLALALTACGSEGSVNAKALTSEEGSAPASLAKSDIMVVSDTAYEAIFNAAGTAEPFEEATLSTTLMGTVTEVLVHEGASVQAGQVLLRIDAGELSARALRMSASVADAEAIHADAVTQERRFRALYQDSAATRAQYEAASTGLARAEAALRAARAASAELDAASRYSTIRAPFNGVVTRRMIDRGGMAAPGMPLLTVQNTSMLRLRASAPIEAVRSVAKGQILDVTIDNQLARATIEGIVPSGSSNLFTVNAIVQNPTGRYAAGSSGIVHLATGAAHGVLIPQSALIREGDMVGVIVEHNGLRERQWIRVGNAHSGLVEVASGLVAGDRIVVPLSSATSAGTVDTAGTGRIPNPTE